jgi:hypothetical protein
MQMSSKQIVVKVSQWFTIDVDNLGGADTVRRAMHVNACDALSDDDIKYFITDHIASTDFIYEYDADTTEYDKVEVIDV